MTIHVVDLQNFNEFSLLSVSEKNPTYIVHTVLHFRADQAACLKVGLGRA